jgi:hypothetical protein
MIDRESAFEILKGRAESAVKQTAQAAEDKKAQFEEKQAEMARKQAQREEVKKKPGIFEKVFGAFGTSAARSLGNSIGKEILRGPLGNIFGGGGSRRK